MIETARKIQIRIMRLAMAAFVPVLSLWLAAPAGAQTVPLTADQLPTLTLSLGDGAEVSTWSFRPAVESVQPLGSQRGWRVAPPALPHGLPLFDQRASFTIEALEFDHNPFVIGNILVTNNTDATQSFSLSVTLPTTFPAPNIISGSVDSSVEDLNGDGATMAAPVADSVYTALIDGAPVATLQDAPFSLVAAPNGSAAQLASFGPSASVIPVTASIAMQIRLTLSARDRATVAARFDVVGAADLEVTKDGVVSGSEVVYTITVTNNGPADATNVVVTDPLPAMLTYVGDDCGASNVPPWTWAIPSLASGASEICSITTAVVPPFSGDISNTASAVSDEQDPEPGNNSDTVRLTVDVSLLQIPTLGQLAVALLALLLASVALLKRRGSH